MNVYKASCEKNHSGTSVHLIKDDAEGQRVKGGAPLLAHQAVLRPFANLILGCLHAPAPPLPSHQRQHVAQHICWQRR